MAADSRIVVGVMRIGAIDIGSNSTRLLLADVENGVISELARDSIVTRLGDGVDANGELNPAAIERVRAAIADYAQRITQAGCDRTGGVATSAVRDAANGEAFVQQLEAEFAIGIEVIGGDREAQLTFIGAQTGDALDPSRTSLTVDIGGGSTEFIIGQSGQVGLIGQSGQGGQGGQPSFHTSTKLGAVRQSERHLKSDPPSAQELDALLAEATEVITNSVPPVQRRAVQQAVAVAGTPTVLAAVDQALDPFDPWKVHGYTITDDACQRLFGQLSALPLSERRKVTGLHPDRAPTIVAGAAILLATMRAFTLEAVTVSEHDILYGIALQLASD